MLKVELDKIILKSSSQKKLLVQNINFTLPANHIFTIIGKNGSGKTTLVKALTKLLDEIYFEVNGNIFFENENLFLSAEDRLNVLRRSKIKYVFQDAINCFDPLKKLGYYFSLIDCDNFETEKTFEYFRLPSQNKIASMFPYELSGGMAQRLMFVLALIANPSLIIMDEPTSGIDVGIANLFLLKMKEFISQSDHSILMITQDIDFALKAGGKISLLKDKSLSEFVPAESLLNQDSLNKDNLLSAYRELL